jgi:hypothetical protein
MYTSIIAFALAGLVPTPVSAAAPSWLSDYSEARALGTKEHKPLAVFLGSGKDGWSKLSREGGLSSEAKRLLAEKYICVYINTATETGKAMAAAFDISAGLGIVVSDRAGQAQAYRHEGDLVDADLVRYLQRYGDPAYVARATESNPGERISNYSPEISVTRGGYSTSSANCST